ncbi:MAG: DegV family protein [Lachnospiraceae bacterium]|nr:DegV family protein [Lachnospiraceae bacterium]
MKKIAIVTDSNSGITQKEAAELGIRVLPMPFYINETMYYEDITLDQDTFYARLAEGAEISTSQPMVGDVLDLWNELLREYDEIVHIPMSSGLSGSCETALSLAQDFEGKVQVVNNQRISVTQRLSVLEALQMAKEGMDAAQIRQRLEETRFDSSIYIMVDTLTYLRKGGRLTPAVAAIGSLLRLKPVLQIQGEKLDAFATSRSVRLARKTMIEAVQKDAACRFGGAENCVFPMAYTHNPEELEQFRQEAMAAIPGHSPEDFYAAPLSLSISCHIGPGALAITCCRRHS